MKFFVKIDKMVGCGIPGCSEGCDDARKFYLLATSKEDAADFVARYVRGMGDFNLKSDFWEASTEDPELDVWHTDNFAAEEWQKEYDQAETAIEDARKELLSLVDGIPLGTYKEMQEAVQKFQLAIEHAAFLRGG